MRDIEVAQNEDYSEFWGYANGTIQSNTPFNLAGASAIFTIQQSSDNGATQILRLTSAAGQITFGTTTISGVTFATITVTIPHATTATLPQGTFYYDIEVSMGGSNTYYAAGACVITPTASR